MKKLHLIAGVILMLFGAFTCLQAAKLSFGTSRSPGPAMLPFGAGVLLILLAAIFLVASERNKEQPTEPARALWRGLKWRRISSTLAALLIYAFLLEGLGYIITTSLLMVFLFWGKESKTRLLAVGAGVGVSILSYVLFGTMLKVHLPSGLFGL